MRAAMAARLLVLLLAVEAASAQGVECQTLLGKIPSPCAGARPALLAVWLMLRPSMKHETIQLQLTYRCRLTRCTYAHRQVLPPSPLRLVCRRLEARASPGLGTVPRRRRCVLEHDFVIDPFCWLTSVSGALSISSYSRSRQSPRVRVTAGCRRQDPAFPGLWGWCAAWYAAWRRRLEDPASPGLWG